MQTDYKIVEEESQAEPEQQVRDLMQQGWVCQGGVQVIPDTEADGADWSYQAMVKLSED
ncbi:MAG: DUF1737 domain-containing protein [Acidobacteriota bacterium]|nr:MAG: DUF1737 domain-containing protein [Acidobacteriota bacterium]